VNPNSIPQDLKGLDRWVVWKYVADQDPDTGEVEWDKPPRNALTGGLASSTNPSTWASYSQAWEAYAGGGLDGLGFVLHRPKGQEHEAGLVGIGLDHCRDPESGEIEAWAQEVLHAVSSYAEISPSGCGIRIFLYGHLPPHGRKKGDFEVYQTSR